MASTPPTRLRIGLLAPPWVAVPPPAYGGTEAAIDVLARALAAAGQEVVLYAPRESTCPVPRRGERWAARPRMGEGSLEMAAAIDGYRALRDCDVVHDHTLLGPLYGCLRATDQAMVTTAHGLLDGDNAALYETIGRRMPLIAISRRQALGCRVAVHQVIHHALDLDAWPVGDGGGGFAAFMGRMAPDKGVARAAELARKADVPLRIAAKMTSPDEHAYFEAAVRPLLGGSIEYLGELGRADKMALLGEATSLLNPIAWHEPFGMVMIEALASGTPVLATPLGAAPEIVRHGRNGWLCLSDAEFVSALQRPGVDRRRCRADAEARFSMARLAEEHLQAYRSLGRRQGDRAPALAG